MTCAQESRPLKTRQHPRGPESQYPQVRISGDPSHDQTPPRPNAKQEKTKISRSSGGQGPHRLRPITHKRAKIAKHARSRRRASSRYDRHPRIPSRPTPPARKSVGVSYTSPRGHLPFQPRVPGSGRGPPERSSIGGSKQRAVGWSGGEAAPREPRETPSVSKVAVSPSQSVGLPPIYACSQEAAKKRKPPRPFIAPLLDNKVGAANGGSGCAG